jgi:hypothetical protein
MSASVVRVNGQPNSPKLMEYVLDSPSDVSGLSTDVADGSQAWTKDLLHIYIFKGGTWSEGGAS